MKKALLSGAFLIASLQAITLEDVIKNALENNSSLKELAIEEQITYEKIDLSDQWMNPTLSLGITSVQSDISQRDLEPMQASFVGLSQKIPLGNKLKLQKEVATSSYEISSLLLQNERLKLTSMISNLGYDYLILEQKLQKLQSYQNNIQALKELTRSLYESNKSSLEAVVQTSLLEDRLRVKINNVELMQKKVKLNLEKYSFTTISSLEHKLILSDQNDQIKIEKHPQIKIFELQKQKSHQQANVERASKNSDLTVNMAYFKRDDKFTDYMNFSVALPLSFYKTEELKYKVQKLKAQSFEHKIETLLQNFTKQIKQLQVEKQKAFENTLVYEQKILPQREAIQKLLQSYNARDLSNPLQTINHLNLIIEDELKLLDEKQNFFKAQSQLIYYKGELNE